MNVADLAETTGHWQGEDGRIHSVEWQGETLRWTIHKPHSRVPTGLIRGTCTTFSRKSRLNMYRFINRVNWTKVAPAVFVTLTYPDAVLPKTQRELNTHRYLWHRHLENHLDARVPCIWRIEWEPRKSGKCVGQMYPHWHIFCMGVRYVPHEAVNAWWRQGIDAKGYVRTSVEAARSARECGKYIAKYVAKEACSLVIDAYLNNVITGRRWGILRKNDVPMCPRHEFRVAPSLTTEECLQIATRALHSARPVDCSFTLFGKIARLVGAKVAAELGLTGMAECG